MSEAIEVGDRFEWTGSDGGLWKNGKAYAVLSIPGAGEWEVESECGPDEVYDLAVEGGHPWRRLPRVPAKAASEGSAMPEVGRRVRIKWPPGNVREGEVTAHDGDAYAVRANGSIYACGGPRSAPVTWQYIDEPAAVPRRAMSVADLKPGMRVNAAGFEGVLDEELTLQFGRLSSWSAHLCRDWDAANVMILAEPDAKPVARCASCGSVSRVVVDGPMVTCFACDARSSDGGTTWAKPVEAAADTADALRYAMGVDWGANIPVTRSVQYTPIDQHIVTCDIRCTVGAPCRGPVCGNAQMADQRETLMRETYRMEAAQEAEKQAILAQWKREQEAPLPVVQPFGALRAALASPFVRVVRRGR